MAADVLFEAPVLQTDSKKEVRRAQQLFKGQTESHSDRQTDLERRDRDRERDI